MIAYLLQSAAIIAAGWLFYTVFLRRETFFSVNRVFLLSLVVAAFVMPRLPVPRSLSIRAHLETPAILPQTIIDQNNDLPVTDYAIQRATDIPMNTAAASQRKISWILLIYWAGVAVLGMNFAIQFCYIFYKRWKLPAIRDGKVTILEEKENQSPGSFWNYIFINPEKYDWATYEQILAHEKVHVQKKHSADLIIAELLVIFQWFNPFSWLLRRSMEANLEFQTDHTLLCKRSVDITGYQLSLVQVATPNQLLSIQSAYNQSLLQQRIRMMTQRSSNLHQSWKYLAAVPVLLLIVAMVNTPAEPASGSLEHTVYPNPKPYTAASALSARSVAGKDRSNIVKQKPDIGIPDSSGPQFLRQETIPAVPERQSAEQPAPQEVGDNVLAKHTTGKQKGVYAAYGIADIEKLNKAGVTASVLSGYKQVGWGDLPADDLLMLFRSDITASLIQSYQGIGLRNLDVPMLMKLHRYSFTASEIQSYFQIGLAHLPIDSLYYLSRNGISASVVQAYQQIGFRNIPCRKFLILRNKKVTPSYINAFIQLGFDDITIDQAIELMNRKVTASHLSELIANGASIPSIGYYLSELKK